MNRYTLHVFGGSLPSHGQCLPNRNQTHQKTPGNWFFLILSHNKQAALQTHLARSHLASRSPRRGNSLIPDEAREHPEQYRQARLSTRKV